MTYAEHKRKLAETKLQEQIRSEANLVEKLASLDILRDNDQTTTHVTTRTQISSIVKERKNFTPPNKTKTHIAIKQKFEKDLAEEEAAAARAVIELCETKITISRLTDTIDEPTKRKNRHTDNK
ncbi:hypothetical protein SARC_11478 [Sphaeroforma arctica JP610]|uniref:Uncharacterized protein n=1 Tax=Sphaeroforma arctica JP610 TaxID=667725 RepID=A0A0L0FHR4_9EUKA|nr:hypothetical protein SARC_11478 [Sphaeroforma arctica JP610]KNC76011.1 hypothetical protein SARC_11478 [Sphaeroforma arctica JP610]|eukprot:XP_014149913.1 hypothetical protein SARC_11478 [Sphaeroforma arctica JP610]